MPNYARRRIGAALVVVTAVALPVVAFGGPGGRTGAPTTASHTTAARQAAATVRRTSPTVTPTPKATLPRARRAAAAAHGRADPAAPWVVSLGDSFISGEAGRWAGNSYVGDSAIDALGPTAYFDSPQRDRELIPLCHRSASAMIHIGDDGTPTTPGSPVNSLNLACSGAQTSTLVNSEGNFKPGLDFSGAGTAQAGQAAMLQQFAATHAVRMVVVSIGGNDFGFADVITSCVEDFLSDYYACSKDPSVTVRATAAYIEKIRARIVIALQNVQRAMRTAGAADGSWTLVVNLNPDTLPLGNGFRYDEHDDRQYDGGCGVYNVDAQWAATAFVPAVRQAAQEAATGAGIPGVQVLDLSGLLESRELCSKTTQLLGYPGGASSWQAPGAVDVSEWANQIYTSDSGAHLQQESLHPDYWGQLAARSCVRQVFAGGTPRGGTCVRSGTGLTSRGEPVVTLRAGVGAPEPSPPGK